MQSRNETELKERIEHIEGWCRLNANAASLPPATEVDREIDHAIEAFDSAVQALRRLRAQQVAEPDAGERSAPSCSGSGAG
jgi:hypothetical protein